VWDFATSEDRTSKAGREIATTTNHGMEMGEHYHSLCNKITKRHEG